jgi:hypothetical protein
VLLGRVGEKGVLQFDRTEPAKVLSAFSYTVRVAPVPVLVTVLAEVEMIEIKRTATSTMRNLFRLKFDSPLHSR